MAETQHQKQFKAALECLTREIDALRNEQAAIGAHREAPLPKNLFLPLAFTAMLGDRLIRLIRIFEDDKDGTSFWYLYRGAPQRMKNIDLERLRKFSDNLRTLRNLIFVHRDHKGNFDPIALCDCAGITDSDMTHAVETVRRALYDLSVEEFGKVPESLTHHEVAPSYRPDFDSLKRLLKKHVAKL